VNLKTIITTAGLLCLSALSSFAQSAELPYTCDADTAYTSVLNQLKRGGYEIDSASKDAGIQTAVVIEGRIKQTGTYLKVTLLPEEKKLRVLVYEEKRVRTLSTASPWSATKVNVDKSELAALKLKDELHW
jgi:hypothetical protein